MVGAMRPSFDGSAAAKPGGTDGVVVEVVGEMSRQSTEAKLDEAL
jgi:hypothetical protein